MPKLPVNTIPDVDNNPLLVAAGNGFHSLLHLPVIALPTRINNNSASPGWHSGGAHNTISLNTQRPGLIHRHPVTQKRVHVRIALGGLSRHRHNRPISNYSKADIDSHY